VSRTGFGMTEAGAAPFTATAMRVEMEEGITADVGTDSRPQSPRPNPEN
jgi:hypothetical protein